MAGKSLPVRSHYLKLYFPAEISVDKSDREDTPASPDQPCPKCNGEGYIVVRVYPWDGCSYDEKPCDLCNPAKDDFEFDY
ncbi:MAG: hypothetical protein C3F13_16290 [Anaerolineales bacterium]|nr:MAG: hypothetical protein C3F13_16290 [Anaerolineales bacterium]